MKANSTMSFEDVDGLDVTVEHGSTSPKQLWDKKDELTSMVDRAKELREKLGDEKYEIVRASVLRSIATMYDCVDEWLPDSLESENNQYIKFGFVMLFADIDQELKNHQELTEFERARAVEGTAALVEELEAEFSS